MQERGTTTGPMPMPAVPIAETRALSNKGVQSSPKKPAERGLFGSLDLLGGCRDYHLLLDEQGDQIFAMTDVLAERVRKIGGTTLRSIGHIAKLQRVTDNDAEFMAATDMLRELMEDNKAFTVSMRDAHEIADSNNDAATTSILEVFIDETEKRTWFLFEATRLTNQPSR